MVYQRFQTVLFWFGRFQISCRLFKNSACIGIFQWLIVLVSCEESASGSRGDLRWPTLVPLRAHLIWLHSMTLHRSFSMRLGKKSLSATFKRDSSFSWPPWASGSTCRSRVCRWSSGTATKSVSVTLIFWSCISVSQMCWWPRSVFWRMRCGRWRINGQWLSWDSSWFQTLNILNFKMVLERNALCSLEHGYADRVDTCNTKFKIFSHSWCPLPKRTRKSVVISNTLPP